jgi:AcrR family transcriptional regulator
MSNRTVADQPAAAKPVARASARERLLASANELFYSEGVQTVGIDRIIEHAGVAKASLYNTFGGKEGLVRAYLESRDDRNRSRIDRALTRFRTPRERLLGVFEAQGELFTDPEFNGCAFVAASSENRHSGTVQEVSGVYRGWVRTLFTDLAAEAGAADPESLARQLHILYDGATLSARMDRDPSAATTARAAAAALLDAALPAPALRDAQAGAGGPLATEAGRSGLSETISAKYRHLGGTSPYLSFTLNKDAAASGRRPEGHPVAITLHLRRGWLAWPPNRTTRRIRGARPPRRRLRRRPTWRPTRTSCPCATSTRRSPTNRPRAWSRACAC